MSTGSFQLIKMSANRAVIKTADRNYTVADRTASEPVIFSTYTGRLRNGTEAIKRKRQLRTDSPLYAKFRALLQGQGSAITA